VGEVGNGNLGFQISNHRLLQISNFRSQIADFKFGISSISSSESQVFQISKFRISDYLRIKILLEDFYLKPEIRDFRNLKSEI
jgi:hypothetical protein